MKPIEIRTVEVTQYIKPLREGGSLPGIVEAEDGFKYVIKFRGAGQGKKALIAELIGAEMARALHLNVPEIVFMNLDDSFSKAEGDEEIQDLLKFSVGMNLGLHYLSGSITFDPLVSQANSHESSKVVLLDSIILNIDRTARNTNLLNWNNELWLIDHGASLYFHHNWNNWKTFLDKPFPMIKDHVLLDRADLLYETSKIIQQRLNPSFVDQIISSIPSDWLVDQGDEFTPEDKRLAYSMILNSRIEKIDSLCKEALDAK